ncbi:MAG: hypothetical protein QOE13_2497 [Gaiellaceae bacterium]|jgi:hypothetical protein|nr:hypothetical protein [Gaiellaceae bacterium]
MDTAPLTGDLLAWIARSPRTYRETMEVWQTHCPRLSIWEDALRAGLVRSHASCVELTELGKAALDAARSD